MGQDCGVRVLREGTRGVLQGPGITWGSSSRVVSPLMAAPRCQESRTLLSAILLAAWPSGPGSHTLIM